MWSGLRTTWLQHFVTMLNSKIKNQECKEPKHHPKQPHTRNPPKLGGASISSHFQPSPNIPTPPCWPRRTSHSLGTRPQLRRDLPPRQARSSGAKGGHKAKEFRRADAFKVPHPPSSLESLRISFLHPCQQEQWSTAWPFRYELYQVRFSQIYPNSNP